MFPSPVDVTSSADHVSCFEVPGLVGNVPGINAALKAIKWINRVPIPDLP